MTNQPAEEKRSSTEQLLDQFLDALAERQAVRSAAPGIAASAARTVAAGTPDRPAQPRATPPDARAAKPAPAPAVRKAGDEPARPDGVWQPPRVPGMHLDRSLSRLIAAMLVLIIVVNVPLNRHGVSLARILPDSASLIVRDGMILKGSGSEIYMLEHDELRWISSMDAFEHLGLRWRDVHVVEDAFLARFNVGKPIDVLLKCDDSPHIYRLENGQKRWIKDLVTLLDEGHEWKDVRMVPCDYLRGIPDGAPIPEDAGPPPQP